MKIITTMNDNRRYQQCLESAKKHFVAGQFKEAIEDHNKAIQLNPNYVEAYRGRAKAKYALKDEEGYKEDTKAADRINKIDDIKDDDVKVSKYQDTFKEIKDEEERKMNRCLLILIIFLIATVGGLGLLFFYYSVSLPESSGLFSPEHFLFAIPFAILLFLLKQYSNAHKMYRTYQLKMAMVDYQNEVLETEKEDRVKSAVIINTTEAITQNVYSPIISTGGSSLPKEVVKHIVNKG